MARKSGNSLLNSLRGMIWISTSVLAFFICTFGLISYLIAVLLTSDVFFSIFVPFVFLAFTVIVFGWWLSNEIVRPIENVTLLAKSIERNSATSLPKTSGSSETDQLLQVLQRNSQQMQNVVMLMDKVAGGDVDVALTPLHGSDRLTESFQKLLSKVSDSISAREELTRLENEVEQLSTAVGGIRGGNLNTEVPADLRRTGEIAGTIKFLLEGLNRTIALVRSDAGSAAGSAGEIGRTLGELVVRHETGVQDLNRAAGVLKQVPGLIGKISEELLNSARSAETTLEKTGHGLGIAQENSQSVGRLRSDLRESINRIQSLSERAQEIAKVAKLVEDLANRTNMIALNASIQATELGEEGRGFVLVSEELERLAARANGTNRQLAMLNSSILAEIGKVENSLKKTMAEVAELSRFSIETNNVLGELERYVGQYLNLQENMISFSWDQAEETDAAFEALASSVTRTEETVGRLKTTAAGIEDVSRSMNNLQTYAAEFRIRPDAAPPETAAEPAADAADESPAAPAVPDEDASAGEDRADEFPAAGFETDDGRPFEFGPDDYSPEEMEFISRVTGGTASGDRPDEAFADGSDFEESGLPGFADDDPDLFGEGFFADGVPGFGSDEPPAGEDDPRAVPNETNRGFNPA